MQEVIYWHLCQTEEGSMHKIHNGIVPHLAMSSFPSARNCSCWWKWTYNLYHCQLSNLPTPRLCVCWITCQTYDAPQWQRVCTVCSLELCFFACYALKIIWGHFAFIGEQSSEDRQESGRLAAKGHVTCGCLLLHWKLTIIHSQQPTRRPGRD